MSNPEPMVVAAARSPIGKAYKGSLREIRADDLATTVVAEVLSRVPQVTQDLIDDLILGCGNPNAEQGRNLARVVAVLAGLNDVPGVTVNRYCASSLQALRMAAHAIRAGEGDTFIVCGVESVSGYARGGNADHEPATRNPRFRQAAGKTQRLVNEAAPWTDPVEEGQLPDVYVAMGITAEHVARLRGVTREQQDEFAAASQNLAEQARGAGVFAREIVPIPTPSGIVSTDDCIRTGVTTSSLQQLRPVFVDGGTVTAGNACPLNDGAAAAVIASDRLCERLGLQPLARIRSTAVSAISPEIMGLGPVAAVTRALGRAGMTVDDIDLFEINEAFAAQVLPCRDDLRIPPDRLNVHGGAIALGHPFGMTGVRILTTLINAMQTRDASTAVEAMCIGGGQGMAAVIERVA